MDKSHTKSEKLSKELIRSQERHLTDEEFRLAVFCRIASDALGFAGDTRTIEERLRTRKNKLSKEFPRLGLDEYEVCASNMDMFIAINKKDRTALLAARGTAKWNFRDWGNNLSIALVLPAARQETLDKFVQKFISEYPEYELTLTGYSLGGYLVEKNAVTTGLKCESFNRGSSPLYLLRNDTLPNIKSHVVKDDFISSWHGAGRKIAWESEHGINPHKLETFFAKYRRQYNKFIEDLKHDGLFETCCEFGNLDSEIRVNPFFTNPAKFIGERNYKNSLQ